MTDQREAIAQAIHPKVNEMLSAIEQGRVSIAGLGAESLLLMGADLAIDAVLPLVDAAYERGLRSHPKTDCVCDEGRYCGLPCPWKASIEAAEQRGYERGFYECRDRMTPSYQARFGEGYRQALAEARAKIEARFDKLSAPPNRDGCAPWAKHHALAALDELEQRD